MSVSVNVFFRDMDTTSYAIGKDVYGNRDLQAYENSRRDLQRIVKAHRGLGKGAGKFYMQRLADELCDIAREWSED